MSTLFQILFLLIPFIFYPESSELFEFNKIITIYIFSILIISLWLLKMIRQKKIIFHHTTLNIPLLLFLVSQTVSSFFSIDKHTSLFGYYSRFNGGLFSSFAYCLLYWAYVSNMKRRDTERVMRNILITGFLISLYAILEHFGHSISCLLISGKFDVSCWVQDVRTRVFATLGQTNWLAAWIVAISPLAWVMALKLKIKDKRYFIWVGVSIVFFITLIFTKSRSGILGFAASSLVFWILTFIGFKKKIFNTLIVFLILHFSFLILTMALGTPWTPSFLTNKVSYPPASPDTTITDSGNIRKIVWQGAFDIWKRYPIFGTGAETFAYSYYQFRPASHNLTSEWNFLYNKAHNEYLNYAANSGTVGLIAYLTLIIFSIYQILKPQKTNSDFDIRILKISFLAGYSSMLVTNFFGFSVVVTSLLFFLFPGMAVSLGHSSYNIVHNKKDRIKNPTQIFAFTITVCATLYGIFAISKYWYSDYLYAKGLKENSRKNFTLATDFLKRAINLHPKESIFHIELAQAYASNGLAEKAEEEVKLAISLSPRNIKILEQSSNIYIDLAEKDESYYLKSIQILERLSTFAPTNARVFYILALTYTKIGQVEKALELAQKALYLKPDYDKAKLLVNTLSELKYQK